MENTSKHIAIILGGSSGIGFATARGLLELGIDTVIVGKSISKLENAKRELSSFGHIETLQANLYESQDVNRVIEFIEHDKRHINYFVNAAGYFKPTPFLEHEHKDYDAYMDLNCAAFFISQSIAVVSGNLVE